MSDDFKNRIEEKDGCWLWKKSINSDGYGHLHYEGKPMLAHRVSYTLFTGPIAAGLIVRHLCPHHFKHCVNPDHLTIGTHKDNMEDKKKEGRCRKGVLQPEQVDEFLDNYPCMSAKYSKGAKKMYIRMMAQQFGVQDQALRLIIAGYSWKKKLYGIPALPTQPIQPT